MFSNDCHMIIRRQNYCLRCDQLQISKTGNLQSRLLTYSIPYHDTSNPGKIRASYSQVYGIHWNQE